MFCGVCGKENPTEHKFCSGCGRPLHSASERPPQNGHYSLVLQSSPLDEFERFRVIRQLAGLLKLSEQELAARVKNTPSTIASVESLAEGEHLQQRLQGVGVKVLIRPDGEEDRATGNGGVAAPTETKRAEHPQRNAQEAGVVSSARLAVANGAQGVSGDMNKLARILVVSLLGFGLLMMAVKGCGSALGGYASSPHTPDRIEALTMAQQFIKDTLQSPSTASFQWASDDLVQDLGEERYQVSTYVDAENVFGAKVRTHYTVVVRHVGNGKWRLEDIATR